MQQGGRGDGRGGRDGRGGERKGGDEIPAWCRKSCTQHSKDIVAIGIVTTRAVGAHRGWVGDQASEKGEVMVQGVREVEVDSRDEQDKVVRSPAVI